MHTTGTDTKQPLQSYAALTLSASMTFRDYAQPGGFKRSVKLSKGSFKGLEGFHFGAVFLVLKPVALENELQGSVKGFGD